MFRIKSISVAALVVSVVVAVVSGLAVAGGFAVAGRLAEADAIAVTARIAANEAGELEDGPKGVLATLGRLTVAATENVWQGSALTMVVLFLLCFLVANLVMRKFVMNKLKPIYQIVLSKDVEMTEMEERTPNTDHFVEEIEGEIAIWAETNRREIARLKDNEQYRKEYVGNVSHEIKTPIFNIQGYISTLLDGGLEDPTINRDYLEKAEKSIDRLINIVLDLEQISKLEAGVLELKVERFDVAALARDMVDSVEMEAQRRDIRMVVGKGPTFPETTIYVRADKHYISQVFVNLLTNSIKYGNDGGETKISFVDLFDKVMVEISDNGVGVEKRDLRHLFERFYRTDKSRSREQGGTGLGLSIVKHIIEAHNESITVRSQPGKGTTFSFTLSKVALVATPQNPLSYSAPR